MGLQCADTASDVMKAVDAAAHVGRRRASEPHERSAHRHVAVPSIAAGFCAGRFPVALRCPKCGNEVSEGSICAATGEPCMTLHEGIPRFLFGQKYWGEIGSEPMRQLLQEAAGSHWRTALLKCVPDEPVTAHLLAPIRADFLHAMPWNRIRNVLDIGAGMGFMSCDMALYADSVVSLEAVPERAEFIRLRARQDRLNVSPVIASAMELPFPPESFDLITLNGVLEYLGLWGEGDPKQLQEEFLRKSLTLLRPGGYLYVGVETRYAVTALLGGRDHSGLPYTSLMPRRLADLYCRLRGGPFYGSEHAARGYRTYTHTPLQYQGMVQRAGYDNVSVHGAFEGYNRQRVLYDLNDHAGRKALLERVNPAASLAGSVRRLLTDNRAVYRTLENEVVIFAQKPAPATSATALPWAEIAAPQRTVVQVNQNFKTLAVVCDQGVPVEILEVEKKGHEDAGRRLQRSFEILGTLQEELKEHLPALPIRWAKARGTVHIGGRVWRRYEYIHGRSLATHLLPRHYDPRVVPQLFTRAIAGYIELCGQLTTHLRGSAGAGADDWQDVEEHLADVQVSEDIRHDFQLAVRHARDAGWRLSVIHGDFSAGNLLMTPSGELVLLDWEHFSGNYPLGADLLRFLQDSIIESGRLKARTANAFRRHLTETAQAALAAYGYRPQDYRHLDALYIGHQVASLGCESRAYQPLLDAYRARRRLPQGPLHEV
jgi:SAM-dependent methyltransferase/aminoglycoside phosphotransferase (APT) family kinase protein